MARSIPKVRKAPDELTKKLFGNMLHLGKLIINLKLTKLDNLSISDILPLPRISLTNDISNRASVYLLPILKPSLRLLITLLEEA